jgi:polynucleotide 5'-kinase involved in rRNA processing
MHHDDSARDRTEFLRAAESLPVVMVVMVVGPRQSGKTTLVRD